MPIPATLRAQQLNSIPEYPLQTIYPEDPFAIPWKRDNQVGFPITTFADPQADPFGGLMSLLQRAFEIPLNPEEIKNYKGPITLDDVSRASNIYMQQIPIYPAQSVY